MKNAIHQNQKQYFVTRGKNHVFGTDFAKRESMPGVEAEKLFDAVWESEIRPRIQNGSPVDADDVRRRVPEANQRYVNAGSEHREFRLSGSLWIAQMTDGDNDQLWIVPNKAYDTRSITATFKTQDQKDSFDRLATQHGFEPQEYARRILTTHISIYQAEE
ncbi:hypothetical protein [Roseimaritima ulvae]|nr:hypothetical protein [Roseimaritima ulvae]